MQIQQEEAGFLEECSLRNLRFLIELQVRDMAGLSETGAEAAQARATLRRLMDMERSIRSGQPATGSRALGVRPSSRQQADASRYAS